MKGEVDEDVPPDVNTATFGVRSEHSVCARGIEIGFQRRAPSPLLHKY